MTRVGHFEKVSYEQSEKDFKELKEFDAELFSDEQIRKLYDDIKLPTRATAGSAGYDFYSPVGFEVGPGQTVKIPTGVRVVIDHGWFLACFPRSSLGFKYRFQLDNSVGVIDSDYAHADNEGHIFAKMTNDSKDGKKLVLNAGDRYMQGIFLPFGVTYEDDATEERHGGIGSSGKQKKKRRLRRAPLPHRRKEGVVTDEITTPMHSIVHYDYVFNYSNSFPKVNT